MNPHRPRPPAVLAGQIRRLAAAIVVLLAAGCGQDAQTLQPYTPAMGVNVDVGDQRQVAVRNLLVISRAPGQGFVSMTLVAREPAALAGVSGTAIEADGTLGSPISTTWSGPLTLPPGETIVLTERPPLVITSPDLVAGTTLRLKLTFAGAGSTSIIVPIYRDQDEFATVYPSWPSTTPSPST